MAGWAPTLYEEARASLAGNKGMKAVGIPQGDRAAANKRTAGAWTTYLAQALGTAAIPALLGKRVESFWPYAAAAAAPLAYSLPMAYALGSDGPTTSGRQAKDLKATMGVSTPSFKGKDWASHAYQEPLGKPPSKRQLTFLREFLENPEEAEKAYQTGGVISTPVATAGEGG